METIDKSLFEVKNFIENVIRPFHIQARASSIDLNQNISTEAITTMIYGDRNKLTLVLRNLLSNALKFTRTASERNVSVTVERYISGIHATATVLPVQNDIEEDPEGRGSRDRGSRRSGSRSRSSSHMMSLMSPSVSSSSPKYLKICVTDTGAGIKEIALRRDSFHISRLLPPSSSSQDHPHEIRSTSRSRNEGHSNDHHHHRSLTESRTEDVILENTHEIEDVWTDALSWLRWRRFGSELISLILLAWDQCWVQQMRLELDRFGIKEKNRNEEEKSTGSGIINIQRQASDHNHEYFITLPEEKKEENSKNNEQHNEITKTLPKDYWEAANDNEGRRRQPGSPDSDEMETEEHDGMSTGSLSEEAK
eukprot:gene7246-14782_t